jgi:hypothetical protein
MAHYWSRSRTPTSANGRATSNATTAISGSMCRIRSSLSIPGGAGRGGAGRGGFVWVAAVERGRPGHGAKQRTCCHSNENLGYGSRCAACSSTIGTFLKNHMGYQCIACNRKIHHHCYDRAWSLACTLSSADRLPPVDRLSVRPSCYCHPARGARRHSDRVAALGPICSLPTSLRRG